MSVIVRESAGPLAGIGDRLLIPGVWAVLFVGLFVARDGGPLNIAIAALGAVALAHVVSLLAQFRASRAVALLLIVSLIAWVSIGEVSPSLREALLGAMLMLCALAAFMAAGEVRKGHGMVTPAICLAAILVIQMQPQIAPGQYLALVALGAAMMIACGIKRNSAPIGS